MSQIFTIRIAIVWFRMRSGWFPVRWPSYSFYLDAQKRGIRNSYSDTTFIQKFKLTNIHTYNLIRKRVTRRYNSDGVVQNWNSIQRLLPQYWSGGGYPSRDVICPVTSRWCEKRFGCTDKIAPYVCVCVCVWVRSLSTAMVVCGRCDGRRWIGHRPVCECVISAGMRDCVLVFYPDSKAWSELSYNSKHSYTCKHFEGACASCGICYHQFSAWLHAVRMFCCCTLPWFSADGNVNWEPGRIWAREYQGACGERHWWRTYYPYTGTSKTRWYSVFPTVFRESLASTESTLHEEQQRNTCARMPSLYFYEVVRKKMA